MERVAFTLPLLLLALLCVAHHVHGGNYYVTSYEKAAREELEASRLPKVDLGSHDELLQDILDRHVRHPTARSILSSSTTPKQNLDTQCQKLYKLFEYTGPWELPKKSVEWNLNLNCCTWYGVSCYNEQVTGVALSGFGGSGQLPDEIGDISSLVLLIIANSKIESTLPANWMNLSNMILFSMEQNNIYGSIPDDIGDRWPILEKFIIQQNKLIGTIPSSFGKLSNLQILGVAMNGFTGQIPPSIANLQSLEVLFVESNDLSGEIPWSTFGQLRKLQKIALGDNVNMYGTLSGAVFANWTDMFSFSASNLSISGAIPTEIGLMKKLNYFFLAGLVDTPGSAHLATIPTEIGQLSELRTLYVNFVGVAGTLPTELGLLDHLGVIMITESALSGPLPTELGMCSNLTRLFLNNNNLNGSIPSELGAAESLSLVLLGDNGFNGTLPSELGNAANLQVFGAPINFLSGTLPSELALLKDTLGGLHLGGNRLTGSIPVEFEYMSKLQAFDLSGNQFSGPLPDVLLASAPPLIDLRLHNNRFNGTIPDSISAPIDLEFINLESNELSGPLKLLSFAGLVHLQELRLGNNLLSDELGFTLKYLTSLQRFDISYCRISGTIPDVFGNLKNLTVFKASGNSLTGTIPPSLQIGPQFEQVWLDNNQLNGEFNGFFGGNSLAVARINSNNLTGTLSPAWSSSVLEIDVSYNPYLSGRLPSELLNSADSLTLDVSGDVRLQPDPHETFSFVEEAYNLYPGGFECHPLRWNSPYVTVVGLDAQYFRYEGCRCSSGLSGSPPNCSPTSQAPLLTALAVTAVVSLLLAMLLLRKRFHRWRMMNRLMKRARELLEEYTQGGTELHGIITADSLHTSKNSEQLRQALLGNAQKNGQPLLDPDMVIEYGDIVIVKTVARGASGSVSLGLWNNTHVAVKEFHENVLEVTPDGENDFTVECAVHGRLRHPNVVQLLAVCSHPPCTITEWMDRGSLFDTLRNRPEWICGREIAIALDIARGMNYLHARGVLHRDLKSLNVLLNHTGIAKVADFGLSRRAANTAMTLGKGTPAWMAPEIFGRDVAGLYSEKCDVYSFGIVLWELVSKDLPFKDLVFLSDYEKAAKGGLRPTIPDLPADSPLKKILVPLMEECWSVIPESRPTFKHIVECLETAAGSEKRTNGDNEQTM